MKKLLGLIVSLSLLTTFALAPGCQKAEEKKMTEAPATTPAPAPEEKKAEEGKPAETTRVTVMGKISEKGDIVTDDGKEYVVADEDMRKELMGLVNKKVKATGTVEEREGKTTINVVSYEVIGE
jgi:hypothetical protein